ncbi:MAG: DUF2796 domain-containing protein, partial [Candidatus Thiodiazotropha taylori]|nr:DUF2796 domain-containing protein [Candidatus Thiodiazotropha taylori]
MTKTNQSLILLSIPLLAASNQLQADSDHEQHDAHVHGEAQMLIALDGTSLELEFKSPAMNIVGFEHQPKSEKQVNAVKAAMETLKQPNQIFTLSTDAQCSPVSIEVESPLAKYDGDEHDHDHDHKHDDD